MFNKLINGSLPLRVVRAKYAVDGEYDYSISAEINGKWYVIAEFYGRCDDNLKLPAQQISNYILSLIHAAGTGKTLAEELNAPR